jgi:hypothetical protein
VAKIHKSLLAAEPGADDHRKAALRIDVQRQARQSPLGFDLAISWSKDISSRTPASAPWCSRPGARAIKNAEALAAGLLAEVDQILRGANNAALACSSVRPGTCARLSWCASQRPGIRVMQARELTRDEITRARHKRSWKNAPSRTRSGRADLIANLGRVLSMRPTDPDEQATMLEEAADRALVGEAWTGRPLEAPEAVPGACLPPFCLVSAGSRRTHRPSCRSRG